MNEYHKAMALLHFFLNNIFINLFKTNNKNNPTDNNLHAQNNKTMTKQTKLKNKTGYMTICK